jgi:hypothetical protein
MHITNGLRRSCIIWPQECLYKPNWASFTRVYWSTCCLVWQSVGSLIGLWARVCMWVYVWELHDCFPPILLMQAIDKHSKAPGNNCRVYAAGICGVVYREISKCPYYGETRTLTNVGWTVGLNKNRAYLEGALVGRQVVRLDTHTHTHTHTLTGKQTNRR